MSENWTFHDRIAIPLETMTENQGKIDFNADVIDAGAFVDAMLSVLQLDADKLPLYAEFFRMCAQYRGKRHLEIPDEDAKALYDTFKAITSG